MPAQVYGKIVNERTLILNRAIKAGEKEIIVKLKIEPIVRTKIVVPEDIVLEISEIDLEELI